jgi:putative transposase
MGLFSEELLNALEPVCDRISAWCVLPNHYHALVHTSGLKHVLAVLGKLHGRTWFQWNGDDMQRGRKVWFNCAETVMKSDRHYLATLNYVHHNPVRHGYVPKWQDWPFSSGASYIESVGREKASIDWKNFPIDDYGDKWDPPEL